MVERIGSDLNVVCAHIETAQVSISLYSVYVPVKNLKGRMKTISKLLQLENAFQTCPFKISCFSFFEEKWVFRIL